MRSTQRQLPGTVAWARRLCAVLGGLLAFGTVGLAYALVALPPTLAERSRVSVATGILSAGSAFGLLWAALGVRERSRWGWRAGVAAYVALIAADLSGAGSGGGPRVGLGTLVELVGLWTLLSPTTRRWFDTSEEELRAAEAEDRSIRRARRHLTEEAPSLWDISLRDLPRREDR